jgi:hypothetical protein
VANTSPTFRKCAAQVAYVCQRRAVDPASAKIMRLASDAHAPAANRPLDAR